MIKVGDKSVHDLSKELGIQNVTLYSWVRKYDEDKEEAFPEGETEAVR